MGKIGRIYGEIIGDKFTFASKDYFSGDFVKIKENEDLEDSLELICEVLSRGVSNPFLTTPEVIKYLDDSINFQRDTIYTYTVASIGAVRHGKISSERVHTLPGKNVYTVDAELLKAVYGIGDAGPQIGYLKKMPGCEVTLDINKIFNPHLFIVGKTGSGKSYFTTRFLAQMEETFWVFSPTDEYSDLNSKSECTNLSDFILDLNSDDISYYANLNMSEEMILKSISFQEDKVYSYKELVEEIQNYYRKKNSGQPKQISFDFADGVSLDVELPAYANSLITKLKSIRHLRFSKNRETLQVFKGSLVFELGEYTQSEQECILNYYLYDLLQRCKRTKPENRKKYIIVIEEAHNYVPSVRNTLSKSILVRLSREGRKYGISLCFITQRPRFFDQTALSQSGNKIIFALPNPEDVRHIMEDIPFYKTELATEIQSQKTGECIIAGDSFCDVLEIVVRFGLEKGSLMQ